MAVFSAVVALLLSPQGKANRLFRHGLSFSDAESLSRRLAALELRDRRGTRETVIVTECELNSYLNLGAPSLLPPELSDVEFRLERDRVEVRGMLDLDRLQGKVKTNGVCSPLALLGGRLPLELTGRLRADGGFGAVEVEEIRLGSLLLPLSVLEQIVASLTHTAEKPQGFDFRSRFPLPFGVKRLQIEPGRVLLEF